MHQLVDIVSKNGNLLLNFGPKSDGTIPDEIRTTLLDMGAWLKVNGEAIYGTTPWKTFGEGPTQVGPAFHDTETKPYTAQDFRFTEGKHGLCHWHGLPADGHAVIHALGLAHVGDARVAKVELIGSSAPVAFHQTVDGLELTLPPQPTGKFAYAFHIQVGSQ